MTKKILALLLTFVSLTSIALAWKSAEWKVSFTEPAGWQKHATDMGVHFSSPDGRGSVSLQCEKSQQAVMTQAEAERHIKQNQNWPMPHSRVLGSKIVKINGITMVKTTIAIDLRGGQRTTMYSTIRNHIDYSFMLTCEANAYSRMAPVLDNMVKSAKFQ
ncbi:MAG: hypothetical protein K6G50_08875 [bacterium]|nr:hypothetical protein [bacterium]